MATSIKALCAVAYWATQVVGSLTGAATCGLFGWWISGYHEIGGWIGFFLWGVLWALGETHALHPKHR